MTPPRQRKVPLYEDLDGTSARQDSNSPFKSVLRAMRLHHWSKNALIFLPLLMAHKQGDMWRWRAGLFAFAAFCLLASSVYVINDLLDLSADRRHPLKRWRPFASGALSSSAGVILACLLLAGSAGFAWCCGSLKLAAVLIAYFVFANAYSLRLKHEMLLDVVVLAGLYTSRILAGGAAYDISISTWMVGFSGFLFLSMALVKRVSELDRHIRTGIDEGARGYLLSDVETLTAIGIVTGGLAALVIVLYMSSTEVVTLYSHPNVLWTISPVFLYWINRLWIKTRRGQVHEDPILYCARDKTTYWVVALVVAILVLASGYVW